MYSTLSMYHRHIYYIFFAFQILAASFGSVVFGLAPSRMLRVEGPPARYQACQKTYGPWPPTVPTGSDPAGFSDGQHANMSQFVLSFTDKGIKGIKTEWVDFLLANKSIPSYTTFSHGTVTGRKKATVSSNLNLWPCILNVVTQKMVSMMMMMMMLRCGHVRNLQCDQVSRTKLNTLSSPSTSYRITITRNQYKMSANPDWGYSDVFLTDFGVKWISYFFMKVKIMFLMKFLHFCWLLNIDEFENAVQCLLNTSVVSVSVLRSTPDYTRLKHRKYWLLTRLEKFNLIMICAFLASVFWLQHWTRRTESLYSLIWDFFGILRQLQI